MLAVSSSAFADDLDRLLEATDRDDVEAVEALVVSGNLATQANRHGVTALSLACRNGNAEMVRLLLEAGADANAVLAGGETCLMTASRTGSSECVKALIAEGAEVNAKERRGQTALMWAAAEGHQEAVKCLLENGAELGTSLDSGFTPLLFAARQGHIGVAKILLDAGADANEVAEPKKPNGKLMRPGTSPLMLAVENGHFELALELVKAGADPNDQRSRYTPLHAMSWVRKSVRGDGVNGMPPPDGSGSVTSLECVRKLVEAGADVNARLKNGRGNAEAMNPKGATPFFMAAETCDLPFMRLLVELGADPTIPNADNTPPILMVCGIGVNAPGEEAGTEDDAIEALLYLLELGADINATDNNRETVMHGAAYKASLKLVALLDEKGADIKVWNQKNRYGRTPLTIARGYRRGNFRPIVEMMDAVEALMTKNGEEVPPRGDGGPDTKKKGYGK
ncbi:ankyrin repeat domain-containing protein [Haloferula chungangensis]|uniref:Ankyrin repeat domain-containing protein n=1 Tax=Haloferula chungangensis TaxID=1048331 RepID=A0ABW2L9Y5_9BACT